MRPARSDQNRQGIRLAKGRAPAAEVRPPHLKFTFVLLPGTNPRFARICDGQGSSHHLGVGLMRNAPDLNSADNTAIRAEIAERLRALLSKEQPGPSPRVQHLIDCLSALDDQ